MVLEDDFRVIELWNKLVDYRDHASGRLVNEVLPWEGNPADISI